MENQQHIREILKPILWDHDIDAVTFYETALGKRKKVKSFTREKALVRILERVSWYDLIELFGLEGLKDILTKKTIARLRIDMLREKYELARKVLHGEDVSFSGWDPEARKTIEPTMLSNRWNRHKPGLPPFKIFR